MLIKREMMFNKIVAYSSHSFIAAVCVASTIILIPQLWIPIYAISVMMNMLFKKRCWGFYYNNRENINVELINVGPRSIKR